MFVSDALSMREVPNRMALGEQVNLLNTPHDRAVALRKTTAATQVLLARAMVMRALSLLSVR